jgi:hypothetical protein
MLPWQLGHITYIYIYNLKVILFSKNIKILKKIFFSKEKNSCGKENEEYFLLFSLFHRESSKKIIIIIFL